MKTRIYLRVAKGGKVAANVRPSYEPLSQIKDGRQASLPTAFFALDVDVPDEILKRAEHVAATVTLDAEDGQVIVAPLNQEAPDAG